MSTEYNTADFATDRETGLKLFHKRKGVRVVTCPLIQSAETILRLDKDDEVVILGEPGLGSKERVFFYVPLELLLHHIANQNSD